MHAPLQEQYYMPCSNNVCMCVCMYVCMYVLHVVQANLFCLMPFLVFRVVLPTDIVIILKLLMKAFLALVFMKVISLKCQFKQDLSIQ
jgi:hypothetical protein